MKCRKIKIQKEITEENTKPINAKLIVSWIQSAMLENDDVLQELQATILVNASTKDFKDEIRIAYIDIIKSLTSLDVKILEVVYSEGSLTIPENDEERINLSKKFNTDWVNIEISIDSLKRLRLIDNLRSVLEIQEDMPQSDNSQELKPVSVTLNIALIGQGALQLTALGEKFCTRLFFIMIRTAMNL